MKFSSMLVSAVICVTMISNAFAKDIQLKFNDNGKFKIAQFTDTHVHFDKNDSKHVFELMRTVIDAEKPDLIVFSGDVVLQHDQKQAYDIFEQICKEKDVLWAVVLGNHDEEHNVSRKDIGLLLSEYPHCITNVSYGIKGATNFVYPVYGKNDATEAVLYFLDSNSYSAIKDRVDGYGWFGISQIQWYKEKSAEFTKANDGKPVPALAFFHIPLPEYNIVWDDPDIKTIGVKNESVCCPKINSGMFAAMVECGDVMGTFVGHDHVNDYIGGLYGIALAYGRASGGKNTYGNLKSGSRIIELTAGKREFDTWIRELDGNVEMKCNFPKDFPVKKKKKK